MTRDHQRVTEYLLAENALLREQLRGRRLKYTDGQRRRLATAAKKLGRKALRKLDTLVTPDTLMRWYRRVVARNYDSSARRSSSQPRRPTDIVELVLRMAKENATWGYTMELSAEKTLVTHVDKGFDFLGHHVRRVPWRKTSVGWTYPSKKSLEAVKHKVRSLTTRSTTY
jgi:putative transposase